MTEVATYEEIYQRYEKLTKKLIEKKMTITTMESCTSGYIASLLTDTEGASATMKGAFVTYSNEAKIMQKVPAETIEKYGVYSFETAAAMAKACRECYDASLGIGVTGTFSNVDPNNSDSVPGMVYVAICYQLDSLFFTGSEIEIPTDITNRNACKRYIADIVAKMIQLDGYVMS